MRTMLIFYQVFYFKKNAKYFSRNLANLFNLAMLKTVNYVLLLFIIFAFDAPSHSLSMFNIFALLIDSDKPP